MRIPFSIILDELNLQYTYHLDEHDHPQFEWAKLWCRRSPLLPKISCTFALFQKLLNILQK